MKVRIMQHGKTWVIINLGEVKPVVEEMAIKRQEGINKKSVRTLNYGYNHSSAKPELIATWHLNIML